jgi:hypothetical protein
MKEGGWAVCRECMQRVIGEEGAVVGEFPHDSAQQQHWDGTGVFPARSKFLWRSPKPLGLLIVESLNMHISRMY